RLEHSPVDSSRLRVERLLLCLRFRAEIAGADDLLAVVVGAVEIEAKHERLRQTAEVSVEAEFDRPVGAVLGPDDVALHREDGAGAANLDSLARRRTTLELNLRRVMYYGDGALVVLSKVRPCGQDRLHFLHGVFVLRVRSAQRVDDDKVGPEGTER